ncbi:MAG TPA: hypothetical protein VGB49_04800 [Caulobacteraceae bacterium]|jgi:hypothetical protein
MVLAGALSATMLALLLQASARPSVVGYEEAVRCAGLTQAASELAGLETDADRALYERAIYWSLTTTTLAQARGARGEQAEQDQTRARVQAVRELTMGSAAARASLQRCAERTPNNR